MEVNPTFGELLDSLSRGSEGSSSSHRRSRQKESSSSTSSSWRRANNRETSSSSDSRHQSFDDSFRRMALELSRRAHGDQDPPSSPLRRTLEGTGAFHRYSAPPATTDHSTHESTLSHPSILKLVTVYSKDHQRQPAEPQLSSSSFLQRKGFLSSVLEGHSDSNTTPSAAPRPASPATTLSISTKESRVSTIRGRCLTSPDQGVENGGVDNVHGNLIVYENDAIVVPRKSLHTLTSQEARHTEFRVLRSLGQGTFAQVFECRNMATDEIVAIKIVKNRPEYTRQATVEIDVFRALQDVPRKYLVRLICYFLHHSHLCLVFEPLGMSLYDVLKRRQFRGLPLATVRELVHQTLLGMEEMATKNVVHSDIKPENVLLVSDALAHETIQAGEVRPPPSPASGYGVASRDESGGHSTSGSSSATVPTQHRQAPATDKVKVIDFGSACFEGYTAHPYIQSRFYRSPEVLVGLPYDAAIDMWSLGCVAAELYLGLPILPGLHEHDQLARITELLSPVPDWMIEQGSVSSKVYVKYLSRDGNRLDSLSGRAAPKAPTAAWRLKTQEEFISSLKQSEVESKGGLSKLQKQPRQRYFQKEKLVDILVLHATKHPRDDRHLLVAFAHFLYGLLDPDPWKRWTVFQLLQHPFITGDVSRIRVKGPNDVFDPRETNHANMLLEVCWTAPWDPSICRRKLLYAQKLRDMRQQGRSRRSRASPKTQEQLAGTQMSTPRSSASSQFIPDMERLSTPPTQVSTSGSATSSLSYQPLHMAQGQLGPSSWSAIGHPDATFVQSALPQAQLRQPVGSAFQVRSYSNLGVEADLSNALQRPGVVPGFGTMAPMSRGDDPSLMGLQPVTGGDAVRRPSADPPRQVPPGLHSSTQVYQSMPSSSDSRLSLGQIMPQGQAQNPRSVNFNPQPSVPTGTISSQQVFLMQSTAPGSGVYYMTLDPYGQPILLQPVGAASNSGSLVQHAQMQDMSMQGMPMQDMPIQGMPMQGIPMQGMPMQGMPGQQVQQHHHPAAYASPLPQHFPASTATSSYGGGSSQRVNNYYPPAQTNQFVSHQQMYLSSPARRSTNQQQYPSARRTSSGTARSQQPPSSRDHGQSSNEYIGRSM